MKYKQNILLKIELTVFGSYFIQVYNGENSEKLKCLNLDIKIYIQSSELMLLKMYISKIN